MVSQDILDSSHGSEQEKKSKFLFPKVISFFKQESNSNGSLEDTLTVDITKLFTLKKSQTEKTKQLNRARFPGEFLQHYSRISVAMLCSNPLPNLKQPKHFRTIHRYWLRITQTSSLRRSV